MSARLYGQTWHRNDSCEVWRAYWYVRDDGSGYRMLISPGVHGDHPQYATVAELAAAFSAEVAQFNGRAVDALVTSRRSSQ